MQRKYSYRPLHLRFWAKVDRRGQDECWSWVGGKTTSGYGRINDDSPAGVQFLFAHRVSFELANGPIPPGLLVMHSCDVPWCVNPTHLSIGTDRDNAIDKMSKGRGKLPMLKGSSHPHAKLAEQDVRHIRDSVAAGESIAAVAGRLGLSYFHAWNIVRRLTWRHIE